MEDMMKLREALQSATNTQFASREQKELTELRSKKVPGLQKSEEVQLQEPSSAKQHLNSNIGRILRMFELFRKCFNLERFLSTARRHHLQPKTI